MTILIVYPGFGDDNSKLKQLFVQKLITAVSTKTTDFKVLIFCHGTQKLEELQSTSNVEIVYERGIIGQFLYKHITPALMVDFSHIVIVMDDIEVCDTFDIGFYVEKTTECDIISPCLSLDSRYTHDYMLKKSGTGLASVNQLELFMYIMKRESYLRYYSVFLDKFVSWLWFIDGSLQLKGFACLLNYNDTIKHHFTGGSRNIRALFESIHNMRKAIVPRRIVQLANDDKIKNMFPEFDYVVLDTDSLILTEYPIDLYNQVYDTWNNSPDKTEIAIYLYLFKYGGIWINNNVVVKDTTVVFSILSMIEKSINDLLIMNKEIIFSKAGDENLYSLLLSNTIVNHTSFGHLGQQIIDSFINNKNK